MGLTEVFSITPDSPCTVRDVEGRGTLRQFVRDSVVVFVVLQTMLLQSAQPQSIAVFVESLIIFIEHALLELSCMQVY